MKNTSLLLLPLFLWLSWSCTKHQDEERFKDVIGQISYQNVGISISHGTLGIDGNKIISNVQAPNIELVFKSSSNESVALDFELHNMRNDRLPETTPKQGRLSWGNEPKSVNYSILIPPKADFSVQVNCFPEKKEYKFGAVGDIQFEWEPGEKIAASVEEKGLDFFIHLGDIVMFGSEEQYLESIELMKKFPVPVYHIFGNHDGSTGYDSGYKYFRKFYGKTNYHFSYNNDLFLILDAANQSISRNVFNYAQTTLEGDQSENKFVFLHVPPFDESGVRNNSFSSNFEAARFMNVMVDNEVDVIFSGHIHSYQNYEIAGVRTIVAGIGGGIPEEIDGVGYGYLIINRNESGYSVERIDLEND